MKPFYFLQRRLWWIAGATCIGLVVYLFATTHRGVQTASTTPEDSAVLSSAAAVSSDALPSGQLPSTESPSGIVVPTDISQADTSVVDTTPQWLVPVTAPIVSEPIPKNTPAAAQLHDRIQKVVTAYYQVDADVIDGTDHATNLRKTRFTKAAPFVVKAELDKFDFSLHLDPRTVTAMQQQHAASFCQVMWQ